MVAIWSDLTLFSAYGRWTAPSTCASGGLSQREASYLPRDSTCAQIVRNDSSGRFFYGRLQAIPLVCEPSRPLTI